jgi:N-glycosylase/DNA lyase
VSELVVDGSASVVAEPWWASVWERHSAHYAASATSDVRGGEEALRRELIFCLLGGHGVTFELATSATHVVVGLDPFAARWTPSRLQSALEDELSTPQFEPRRLDGGLRRYRFPARKSALIVRAVAWVRSEGGLQAGLEALESEESRREWLLGCPGVGMKTASWLLRNCGWARKLAILDVHLLRALADAAVVSAPQLPRDYRAVEEAYLEWAEKLGACPAALDLFLWDVQRSAVTRRASDSTAVAVRV